MRYLITKDEAEALNADTRALYVELQDGENKGKFRLKLDDDPVAAYRANNIAQQKKIDDLIAKLATADASKAQVEAALAEFTNDDGSKLDAAEVKRLVKDVADKAGGKKPDLAQAIEAAVAPLKNQITQLTTSLSKQTEAAEAERANAKKERIRSKLRSVVEPVAAQGMADYLVNEMEPDYDEDASGNLVPKKQDDEGMPLHPTKFLDSKRKTAPAFFKVSGVPGKPGDQRPGDPPTMRDGKHVLINPTPLEHGQAMKRRDDSKGTWDFVVETR